MRTNTFLCIIFIASLACTSAVVILKSDPEPRADDGERGVMAKRLEDLAARLDALEQRQGELSAQMAKAADDKGVATLHEARIKELVRSEVQAQRGGPGRGGMMGMSQQQIADQARERAGLDSDQALAVAKIIDETRAQIRNLWTSGNRDREAISARMGELTKQTEKKVAALVTPEQLAKLKSLYQAESGWMRRGGPGEGRPSEGPPGDRGDAGQAPAAAPTQPPGAVGF